MPLSILSIAVDQPVPPAWLTLFILVLILGVSALVYRGLVRHWADLRSRTILSDWAGENHFELRDGRTTALPPFLSSLTQPNPRACVELADSRNSILQIETPRTPASRNPDQPSRWNLLLRPINATWPTTGLRPAVRATSLIEFFPIDSYPSLAPPDRFMVFSADARAAWNLVNSAARGLLPPDTGLVLHDHFLVLDFSARPFDPIEFQRMITLADQLSAVLG
jgi:hypothetical protein